ncbi:MAG: hypothetical protein B7Z74_09175, partial [Deltaproteobacteria bacterium 21-66-5]
MFANLLKKTGHHLAIILLALLCCAGNFARADDLTPGQAAPDLTLHALDGQAYPLSALRGKVVV